MNKSVLAVADSGAQASLINLDLVKDWALEPCYMKLCDVNGNQIRVEGQIELEIIVGHKSLRHMFIAADVGDLVLLGWDLLTACGCVIDFGRRIFMVGDVSVPILSNETETVRRGRISRVTEQEEGARTDIEPDSERGDGGVRPIVIDREIITNATDCETMSEDRRLALLAILNDCKNNLTVEQQERVWELLLEYASVFSLDEYDMGCTNLIEHRIETEDERPIKIPPRRLPIAKREVVQSEINKWLKLGIIRESHSDYSAPVVLVERNGKPRLCVDYRRLNDKTKKDAIPSPNMDAIFDALSGSKYFCSLDVRACFHQIPMEKNSIQKTAFCTENKLYEFLYVPFGLCNSPSTCVRLIESVFAGLSPKAVLTYIDDVMTHGPTFDQTLANLRDTLSRLKGAGLKVNIQKVKLFQKEIKFLGHSVNEFGIRPDENKVEAVSAWPVPKSVTQLKSFLGLCAYERRYIQNFSDIAKPLYDLTKKRAKYCWGEAQQKSFEELKRRLCEAPVLSHFDPEADLIVETDASLHGSGAVLLQVIDGQERVVAYYSKLLSKSQRNYCATKRELLSIVLALAHFHVYLYGHKKFTVRTDHSSLRWLLGFKDLEGQLARWLERLQLYDFNIVYRAGSNIPVADALSRRPCGGTLCKHCQRIEDSVDSGQGGESATRKTSSDACREKEIINCENDDIGLESFVEVKGCDGNSSPGHCEQPGYVRAVRLEGIDLAKAQAEDPALESIRRDKEAGASRPRWEDISLKDSEYKFWWSEYDMLFIRDNILCRRWVKDSNGQVLFLPAIPVSLRDEVMRQVHDGVTAGHFGRQKTLMKLKEAFYWPQRRKTVVTWCKNCLVCASRKGPVKRVHGPMQRYGAGAPMERVAVDVLGPLPVTDRGMRYLLVVMDYFTKWPEALPIENQEATTIATALVNNVFCRLGAPLELHSDMGKNFESTVMAEVCKIFGIKKTRTTPLYPQSDGMVERMNRTLLNSLSAFVSDHQRDWDLCTPLVLLAYRTAVHEATKVTPCEAMLGRTLRGPLELIFPRPSQEHCTANYQYITELTSNLAVVQDFVRVNLDLAGLDTKIRQDRSADHTGLKVGDPVWLFNPRVAKGRSPKLGRPWTGPYKVMERLTDVVYRVQLSPRTKPYTVNRYRLWRVSGTLPEDWWTHGRASATDSPDEVPSGEKHEGDPESETERLEGEAAVEPTEEEENMEDPFRGLPQRSRAGRNIRRPRRFLNS